MNKKIPILLTLLLISCNGNNISSSTSSSSSSEDSYLVSSSELVFPTSSLSSTSSINEESSSSSSEEDISSEFISDTKFDINDAFNALALGVVQDQDYSSITVLKYSIHEDYYQTQNYKMTSYLDNLTLYNGTTTLTYYNDYQNKLVSNFKEQRVYKDGVYSQIRKFYYTFVNSATRKELIEDEALLLLDIGQSFSVYQILSTFTSYYDGRFVGEIKSDGSRYGTFFFQEADSGTGFSLTAALEFELDSTFHLTKFYYTEGYYDSYFCDDLESVKKHGPTSYAGGGYTYEVTMFTKGEKISYPISLPFSEDDNFIKDLSFKESQLTFSISSHKDKYIDLVSYLTSSIDIGYTVGAPVNNITFTSSNTNVAIIGSTYYADFISPGETIITAYDSSFNVTSSNTLKLILTE